MGLKVSKKKAYSYFSPLQKGIVWRIGSLFGTGKEMSYGMFMKDGKTFEIAGQDGPETERNGVYYGYSDVFVIKSTPKGRFVFLVVHRYTNKGDDDYIKPSIRTSRAYKDWKQTKYIRFA